MVAGPRGPMLSRGGAIHSNVFTRFMLTMFGVLNLAERTGCCRSRSCCCRCGFPFSHQQDFVLGRAPRWCRLLVLAALKPRAKNPRGVGVDELFLQKPHSIGMTAQGSASKLELVSAVFGGWTAFLRLIEPLFAGELRARRDRQRGRVHRRTDQRLKTDWARSFRRWRMP